MAKQVSVIIPAYNEARVISRLLRSLKKQSAPGIEIIVVDDGSSDNTVSLAKKFASKVFKRKHAERSVQRNFGAKKASGKYLFFLDADMELSKDVVAECLAVAAADKKIGAIAVPEESVVTNFWERVKAYERSFYNLAGDATTDAARFFTREAFDKVGGYDESITGPEDWDLPETIRKRGYKIGRTTSLIYHYERISSLSSLLKKKYYYGLKAHRYLKKQGISPVSAKTIYFLRPVFYRNWKVLVSNPLMTLAMFTMFACELVAGGLGFIVGKVHAK